MIYIYRPQSSNSARTLAEVLGARRERNFERMCRRLQEGDKVVCWGSYCGLTRNGVQYLNNKDYTNKLQDALKLKEAGVPTVEVAKEKPLPQAQPPGEDPLVKKWDEAREMALEFTRCERSRNPVILAGLATLRHSLSDLQETIMNPPIQPQPIPVGEWLGRSRNHIGGRDLLNPVERPDYYVRKEEIVREFRVHSFRGSSIRAGVKKAASEHAHAWIRSLDAGWRISYDGVTIRQVHREIAHAAVTSLGLDFGAVDIAERQDGSLIVLEVNRAPGLDGGTITAYAEAIRKWVVEG
jgi:hypothetical protein